MLTTIWTISHSTANGGFDATQVPISVTSLSPSCLAYHNMFAGTSQKLIVSEVEAATVFGLTSLDEVRTFASQLAGRSFFHGERVHSKTLVLEHVRVHG